MTLGEFACVVGAPVRWVQNARAVIGARSRYGEDEARRLGMARVIAEVTGMTLRAAYTAAAEALSVWPLEREWSRRNADGSVRIVVDVERYLSGFAARLALSRNYYAERRRGRPRKRVTEPIAAARKYGVDTSLIEASLSRTPEERLRRMDEDVRFLTGLRAVRP
jgi:hypothetical protein